MAKVPNGEQVFRTTFAGPLQILAGAEFLSESSRLWKMQEDVLALIDFASPPRVRLGSLTGQAFKGLTRRVCL